MTITASTSHDRLPPAIVHPKVTDENREDVRAVRKDKFRVLLASFRRIKRDLLTSGTVERNSHMRILSDPGIVLTNEAAM